MSLRHPGLWWGPPRNFNDRKNERKISWLELFYDLVYVAVIGELTLYFSKDPDWNNVAFSFLLFCLIFWSWVNGSQYYDLHGNEGIRTRLLTFWQMLAVAAVAITIPDAYEGRHEDFAIAFLFIQIMITYIWWSVGLYDPSHRVFNKFYTVNYLLAFAVISISIFVPTHVATWLWTLALLLNLTPPLTGARKIVSELKKRGQVFTASSAIVERFGSFTIIVLAESILATVTGIASVHEKHSMHWIAFILSILISFLLWSIYFDMTSEQETKTGYSYMCWFIFLHFPLLACFSFAGACLKRLLEDLQTGSPPVVKWVFCGSIAIILFLIVAITRNMKEEEEDQSYIRPVTRLLIIGGIIILFIPMIGRGLNTIAFLGLIALILFIPVLIGVRSWVRYKFFSKSGVK